MSTYRNALSIDSNASDRRLKLAEELLTSGAGVVVLDEVVALRSAPTCLLCEVVDPAPASRRCEAEFEVLVENAQRLLDASRLKKYLPDLPRKWLVVEDNGVGTVELWRAR